ncbi:hypothetical protein OPV22_007272 [Ensete ventricosum]|uniref:SBP-type domain-containing protein n=1 Tax=Ensete ventricosum TaxID=4639 RepID=A0AAV8RTB6_ENSVE|nr:hypothetical protein OPV22_007272 [Ensete ventricosum]
MDAPPSGPQRTAIRIPSQASGWLGTSHVRTSTPVHCPQWQILCNCLPTGAGPWGLEEAGKLSDVRCSFQSPAVPQSLLVSGAAAPRCQVDGCSKVLVDEKEYHKRHKVCELHSKAPRVVVLGVEQRFCQQCSRFHVISEFDDSKRSCRRRLAGHNERRRKNSSETITRNPALESAIIGGMAPYLSASPGCALSLLSSKASPWITTSDFSSRSSAALNELIAENRAAVLARQLLADGGGWHTMVSVKQQQQPVYWSHLQHQATPQPAPPHADGWSRLQGTGGHVTLDLMQMPDSFEIVSGRSKSREEDEESSDIWKSLAGTHVV